MERSTTATRETAERESTLEMCKWISSMVLERETTTRSSTLAGFRIVWIVAAIVLLSFICIENHF